MVGGLDRGNARGAHVGHLGIGERAVVGPEAEPVGEAAVAGGELPTPEHVEELHAFEERATGAAEGIADPSDCQPYSSRPWAGARR